MEKLDTVKEELMQIQITVNRLQKGAIESVSESRKNQMCLSVCRRRSLVANSPSLLGVAYQLEMDRNCKLCGKTSALLMSSR